MTIQVKAQAAGSACNQWAEVIDIVGGNLKVRLLGDDKIAIVSPDETCGVKIGPLNIEYAVSRTCRS